MASPVPFGLSTVPIGRFASTPRRRPSSKRSDSGTRVAVAELVETMADGDARNEPCKALGRLFPGPQHADFGVAASVIIGPLAADKISDAHSAKASLGKAPPFARSATAIPLVGEKAPSPFQQFRIRKFPDRVHVTPWECGWLNLRCASGVRHKSFSCALSLC